MAPARHRLAAVLAAVAVVAAACSSESSSGRADGSDVASDTTVALAAPTTASSSTSTTTPSSATSPPTTSPPTTGAVALPSTSGAAETLDTQLTWFLDVMNGDDPTAAEFERRFGEEFRAQVSFDDFSVLTPQLRAGLTGWSVVDTDERNELGGTFVIAPGSGEPALRVRLDVAAATGVIETLFLQPAEPPTLDDPPATFDDAVGRLDQLGRSAVLVADVASGECEPIDAVDRTTAVPIGSIFKLYVLGAVAAAIEAGELTWDDEIVFTADLASLPSGITQDEEPGTAFTVLELATRMISISDNTATDMLVDVVGRLAVEDVQLVMGHADADLNRPLPTTRELFIIKLDDDLLDRYATGDADERRAILDEISDRPLPELVPGDFTTEPLSPDEVEWFASPLDLCAALVHLTDLAERPGLEPIRDVMTQNPGLPNGDADEIWFKGGSEPGLVATAWLVRRGDQTFTVTGSVVNPEAAFDETEAFLLFAAIRDLRTE